MTKNQKIQLDILIQNRISRSKEPEAFFVDQKGNPQERLIAEKLRASGVLDLVRESRIGSKKNQIHYKLYRKAEGLI